jgi:hypothetical protein
MNKVHGLKIGDKVLCVMGYSDYHPYEGQIYTISAVEYDQVGIGNSGAYWMEQRFVLATPLTEALA